MSSQNNCNALELAMRYDRTVYDSLCLALAVRQNCQMITANRRLANSLRNTPLQTCAAWIGSRPRRSNA